MLTLESACLTEDHFAGAAVDQLEVIAPGCSSPISEDNLSLSQVATA